MWKVTQALGATALAAAGAMSAPAPVAAQDAEPYVIYLSNNFMGNDWRQQMIRVAEASAAKAPLQGRVDLRVENVENTVQAQINSLNNIIREEPDAILIDAGSAEALNPTIKRACDAGILVISFDQTLTEPCAYALSSDWNMIPAVLAEWMVERLGGEGKVLVDRGLAGAPISQQLYDGYMAVLKEHPGIEVVGEYNGDYALGAEQAGVAALLAANPEVDGVLTQGYGSGAMQALLDAGRPMVPVTGFSYNGSAMMCAQTEGASCILGANPAYLSSEAIRKAVEILDSGQRPEQREILLYSPFVTTHPFTSALYPDAQMLQIEIGANAFPDAPPGLTLPVTPDWVEITAAEASGS